MLVRMADTSYVGLHLFCKMSRQIPPSAQMLGWNILERNLTTGGLFGYSSLNSRVNLKVPSQKVTVSPERARWLLLIITNLEWSFVRSKYDSIPQHDVVLRGGAAHTSRGILLTRLGKFTRPELTLFVPQTCNLLKSLIRRLLAAVVIFVSFRCVFGSSQYQSVDN